MQLDDLRGLEERRRHLREAHHQDRADRKVRRDHRVRRGAIEALCEVGELGLGEPGGADDRVHTVVGAPREVLARGVEHGEVNRYLRVGVSHRGRLRRHLHVGALYAELAEIDAGVLRVDRGNELEARRVDHRPAHRRAHAPCGAEYSYPNHASEAYAANSLSSWGPTTASVRCASENTRSITRRVSSAVTASMRAITSSSVGISPSTSSERPRRRIRLADVSRDIAI